MSIVTKNLFPPSLALLMAYLNDEQKVSWENSGLLMTAVDVLKNF